MIVIVNDNYNDDDNSGNCPRAPANDDNSMLIIHYCYKYNYYNYND